MMDIILSTLNQHCIFMTNAHITISQSCQHLTTTRGQNHSAKILKYMAALLTPGIPSVL
jgi:hypothetical protein